MNDQKQDVKKNKIDKFQKRYLLHQQLKKEQLSIISGEDFMNIDPKEKAVFSQILKQRRSQRVFNSSVLTDDEINYILTSISECPSSCNRQAISLMLIEDRNQKEILNGLLVGGVGWCHRSDKIILLFANQTAYKENLFYMPYLDAGVVIATTYFACETIRVGCCYINPNIRKENLDFFQKTFSKKLFCGALALGHYTKKSNYSPKVSYKKLLIK